MEIENIKTAVAAEEDAERTAIRFVALLIVAMAAPAINVQAVTGTLVNATLFVAAATLGVVPALLIGVVPSAVSALTGLLAPAILPMVPFIIAGNAVLILSFRTLYKRSFSGAVAAASVLKFTLLSGVSLFVITQFVPAKIAHQLAIMMGWPQLLTALSGGVLAWLVLRASRQKEDLR